MIKIILPLLLLFSGLSLAQNLPIDFENNIVTSDFVDFDGGTASVITNPQPGGINTSATVAQIVRNGGTVWSGSKIYLASNLNFSTSNTISMKVYSSAPVGTVVKFILEGSGSTERDAITTVVNEWEELSWDFTGEPTNFNTLVFMFDFGNIGDGSANSTFLFDDIEQVFGGAQLDLPVTFEDPTINYTTTDFGGNLSTLITDPFDANNTVVEVIKTAQAATWAGTTIGTPAGFATNIPLSMSESIMTVRVWSPAAGTPIRLKVEDSNDPTHTCETETNTTVTGDWETMVFDFTNQAPGTELLSIGLGMGWTYNMASIFFDFGTDGANSGEKTYYFDDVQFGQPVLGGLSNNLDKLDIQVFPNPSADFWKISANDQLIQEVIIYDLMGNALHRFTPNSKTTMISAEQLATGTYIALVVSNKGKQMFTLYKL